MKKQKYTIFLFLLVAIPLPSNLKAKKSSKNRSEPAPTLTQAYDAEGLKPPPLNNANLSEKPKNEGLFKQLVSYLKSKRFFYMKNKSEKLTPSQDKH